MADDWDTGIPNKRALWGCLIALDLVGSALCALLCLSVYKMPRKSPHDVLVLCLCSGCVWVSLADLVESAISVAGGRFYGGQSACALGAFFLTSGMFVQFFSVAAISLRIFCSFVLDWELKTRRTLRGVLLVWFLSIAAALAVAAGSPAALAPAGTYCFSGAAGAGSKLVVVCLALSIALTFLAYAGVAYRVHRSRRAIGFDIVSGNSIVSMLRRSIGLVTILLVCWAWTIALLAGAPTTLSGAAQVGAALHTLLAPLSYGMTSPYHSRMLARLCRCALVMPGYGWMVGRTRVQPFRSSSTPQSPRTRVSKYGQEQSALGSRTTFRQAPPLISPAGSTLVIQVTPPATDSARGAHPAGARARAPPGTLSPPLTQPNLWRVYVARESQPPRGQIDEEKMFSSKAYMHRIDIEKSAENNRATLPRSKERANSLSSISSEASPEPARRTSV